MTTRQQLDHETLIGLVEVLESNGVISAEEADALLDRRNFEHAQEAKRQFRKGRGPPKWAGQSNNSGSGGNNGV